MSTIRKHPYQSRGEVDHLEELTAKLSADLRSNVRFMADYPVLSDEWVEMAGHVARMGEVTEMERNLPKKKDATLWECEEVALRYLLEDGKLNLCLRNLVEYNDFLKKKVAKGPIKDTALETMQKFESGMCLTLKNAWLHSEAVQTTDLPLFVEYINSVLTYCVENPDFMANRNMENSQEVIVVYFLQGLMKQIENIDESRIMPLLMEKNIFSLLAIHLSEHFKILKVPDLTAGLEALAIICATEDFQTHSDSYIDSFEAKSALSAMKDDFLDEITEDLEMRKRLRPLLDTIQQINRSRK